MTSTNAKLLKVEPRPGIRRQSTRYAQEGSWYDSQRTRFVSGRPQAQRGYLQVSTSVYDGLARGMHAWQRNNLIPLTSWGTEAVLYVYTNDLYYDITPLRAWSSAVSNPLTVSAGSTEIRASVANHGCSVDDRVFISANASIGTNILVNGLYPVVTVFTSDAFGFVQPVTAQTNTNSGGGNVDFQFLIRPGSSIAIGGVGWGSMAWGLGGWGSPGDPNSLALDIRLWALDNWGEDLVASPSRGPIYYWNSSAGVSVRASVIAAAPSVNEDMLVTPDRFLMVMGTNDNVTGRFDPLAIRWCAQENLNDWTASATNTAGQIRLGAGSRIVGGLSVKNQILIWTDTTLHSMVYAGPPFIYRQTQLGSNCGLIGKNACVEFGSTVYWMSDQNFWSFDGRLAPVPCDVLKYVFDDFNIIQRSKVYAFTNSEFSEVGWLYCSKASNEIDRYVIYDIDDKVWTIGSLPYTAVLDKGVNDTMLAGTTGSQLFFHEPPDYWQQNGQPSTSWIETAEFDIADGDNVMFVDRVIPDFEFKEQGYVDFYFKYRTHPQAAYRIKGPYRVTSATKWFNPRVRARQMSMLVAASAVPDGGWEMGAVRLAVQPDGRR